MATSTFDVLGWGGNIQNSKGNHLLSTKLSQHVIPVLEKINR